MDTTTVSEGVTMSYAPYFPPEIWSLALQNLRDRKGQTLLHLAVGSMSPQMVTLLLNRGAAMSVQGHGGRTPLHLAAERGCQKTIKLLIGLGAEAS